MVAGDEAGGVVRRRERGPTSGTEPAGVYLDLIVPALASIGDRWASGTLSVADEHRATIVAQRLIGRLGPQFARRGRKRGAVVIGAPLETHALPTAIVGDLLRGAGFEVLDIGANSPPESFVDTARGASRLVAIAIAVTSSGRESAVRSVVRALRAVGHRRGGAHRRRGDHGRGPRQRGSVPIAGPGGTAPAC